MATVYIAIDEHGEPLYVGQSARDVVRLGQHYTSAPWWRHACSIELIHLPRLADVGSLEALLIDTLKPPYNRAKARLTDRGRELLERVLAAERPEEEEEPHVLIPDPDEF